MAPEHQPRERAVACRVCYLLTRHTTWNLDAVCDDCHWRQARDAEQVQQPMDQPNDQPNEQKAS